MSNPITHLDTAAQNHVETMVPRADGASGPYPWWHGWALREAFVAGAKWAQEEQQATALQAIADAEPCHHIAAVDNDGPCGGCQRLIAVAREGMAERSIEQRPPVVVSGMNDTGVYVTELSAEQTSGETVSAQPPRLTPVEILKRVKELDYLPSVSIVGGKVHFCLNFYLNDDEETNDAASRTSIDLQDTLRRVGLRAAEIDSDGDSVWGVVEEAEG